MKAWLLDGLGGSLKLADIPAPDPRPGSVVVRIEASSLMSYMKDYVEGKLPIYNAPRGPFIPSGNAIGRIHSVGRDVWHLKKGERVILSSHFVSRENVQDPAQILTGVTAAGLIASEVQSDWPNGTLVEFCEWPVSAITPIDDLPNVSAAELAVLVRYIIPYGGFLRGRLAAGETLIVSGATGAYGTAAVFLAVAMGAARVIAVGRNAGILNSLAEAGGKRVVPVVATGDIQSDVDKIKEAAGGNAQMGFDMVGNAKDPNATLAVLRSLSRNGRLVLMGSMSVPLPLPYLEVMLNNWEVIGQFMYPKQSYHRLLALVRSGQLELNKIQPRICPFSELAKAIERAAKASSFECVVINHME